MRTSELASACPQLYAKVMENLESYVNHTDDANIDGLEEFIESEFNSEDHCYYHIWYASYIHDKISYQTMFDITKAIQDERGETVVLVDVVKLFNLYFLLSAYELLDFIVEKYNLKYSPYLSPLRPHQSDSEEESESEDEISFQQ